MTAIAIALAAVASLDAQAIEEAFNRCFVVIESSKWGRARIRPHRHSLQLACRFTSLIIV